MSKKRNPRSSTLRANNSLSVNTAGRRQQPQAGLEKSTGRRRRNRNKMDPTLVICLGAGVLLVFGAAIVAYGNYKPPSSNAPGRAQVKTIVEKRDSNGNLLTAAQVEEIKKRNEKIKKEKKEQKKRKKKRKNSPVKTENVAVNIAEQRFAEQYGEKKRSDSAPVSTDSQPGNAPVPGWARDSRGRSITRNADNTDGQTNNTQEVQNPPVTPKRRRKSPLAPWKQADGRE